jgi:hypothetical protein
MPIITGTTVQYGTGPLILCDQGFINDREWFAHHHGRNYRIRSPIGEEQASLEAEQKAHPRLKPCVLVRQVKPAHAFGWHAGSEYSR